MTDDDRVDPADPDVAEASRAGTDDCDDLAWETLYGETAYVCPGFDIQREQGRLPDGTETDFDYLSKPPGVVVIPFVPSRLARVARRLGRRARDVRPGPIDGDGLHVRQPGFDPEQIRATHRPT